MKCLLLKSENATIWKRKIRTKEIFKREKITQILINCYHFNLKIKEISIRLLNQAVRAILALSFIFGDSLFLIAKKMQLKQSFLFNKG